MNDTEFAYAVANVRAKENELLPLSFMDQLINSGSYDNAKRILVDKGFTRFENISDPSDALSDYMTNTWDYLMEISPDKDALYFLIVKNDFHNLKSIIKGIVSNNDGRLYCIRPCIIDIDVMYDAVRNKKFDILPKWISTVAEKGYELLTSTMDGQIFDMYADQSSLEAMISFAYESGYGFSEEFSNTVAALTDIKIALRMADFSNNEALMEYAFCECDGIDTIALKKAVQKGRDEVVSFIAGTEYADIALKAFESVSDFERECDNFLMNMLDNAKRVSFGIEPLIAYYYARETEWKNLRIAVSAIHSGMSADAVSERMRELYV